ncbi:MAG: lysophospholipid acyltransferase family protein [Rhodospirillales bacterium]|nr:MAG: lysophospholipid acyltransferase family protein [Rhodospirillales bacterium]
MKPFRKILRSDAMMGLACFLGALYIRLVRYTGRWRIEGEDVPESLRVAGKPFIIAFWHGRLMMMPYSWRRADLVHMLISGHRDGRLISQTVKHFAIESVVGSTSRGGAPALRNLIRLMRQGGVVGITPDGPRGPRMRVAEGTVALARLSGAPIVPATFSASRRRVMNSWDRFVLPLPFARGIFLWGDPIDVPRDADDALMEARRLAVESAMNALADRADRLMGQSAIAPAPPLSADRPVEAGTGD